MLHRTVRVMSLKISFSFLIFLVLFIVPLPDAFGLNEDFPLPTVSAQSTVPAPSVSSGRFNIDKPETVTLKCEISEKFWTVNIIFRQLETHFKIPPPTKEDGTFSIVFRGQEI